MSVANCTAFTGKAGVEVAVAAGIANASGVAASSVMVALSCPSRRLASGLLVRRLADAVNAEYGITIPAGSSTISAASVTNAIVTEGATGLTSKIATAMTAANISGVNLTVTNVPEPTTTSTVSTTAAPSKQDSSARQVFTGSLAAVLAMAMAAIRHSHSGRGDLGDVSGNLHSVHREAGVEVAVAAGIANASGVAASSVMVALSCPSRRLASGLLARRLADAVNAEYGITIPAGSTTISAASVTNAIVSEGAAGLTSKIATAMTAANISGVNLTVTNVPEPTTTSTVSTTAAPSKQDSSARQVFTGSVTVTTVVGTLAMSVANCTAFSGKAGVEVAVAAGIANASGVAASSVMVALSCPSRRLASGLLARRLADAVNAEYGITIPAGSTTISAASVTNAIVTEGATGLTSKIATAMTVANISGVSLTVTNVPEPTTTSTVSTTAAPSKQDSSARQVFTGSLAAVLAMAMAAFA
ncbi:unnamed protein product [Polarella glacialis]|uniref:Uncharacterized protein n=1 Tax=Polarella glacialis TaxID=89957 RepID=A0A813ID28_POLGL|nr:unnamed protein product [Polarella glacialis]